MNWKNDKVIRLVLKSGDKLYVDSAKIVMIACGYWPHVEIITTAHTKEKLLIDVSIGNNLDQIELLVGHSLQFNPTSKVLKRPDPPISKPIIQ